MAAVCASIHISKNTIYRGIRELNGKTNLSSGTVRIAGGGRKAILDEHPEYLVLFDEIVQKHMAGLPQDDSVRWLDLSVAQIIQIFKEHGISISPYIARKMVKLRGFKKRSFHKTKTLKEVKNRDAQFKLLEATWTSCTRLGIPVLSIDTKKKEMLGNFKRTGKTFSCQELAALDHDFVSFSNGTIIPHGIYDVERNVGYLTIGKNSHDTAEFVCDNIARIWKDMLAGKQMRLRHPRVWLLLPPSILRNTKLKERLTNHMYPKDKSESDLINNCLSGTMSLGANLLSIFVPSYFFTVTKLLLDGLKVFFLDATDGNLSL